MLKMRKKGQSAEVFGAPLSISTNAGQALFTFPHEIVISVRHMVTGLSCNGGLPQALTVVSALREEGVTYNSLAVATVIASDLAASVCAVELNWWAPGMVGLLGKGSAGALPAAPRLAEVLAGKATLDEALISTALPNLSLLPAGEVPIEQRPVLARSDALRELIATLRARFNYLLLDVPAVLATSDAIALASLGDACMVVVRHGLTPRTSVQLALDDLSHLKILGVVLNMADFRSPKFLRDLAPQE